MKAPELIAALKSVRVVPVLDPKSHDECLAAVGALVEGGGRAIEITLRTDLAHDVFRSVRAAHPEIVLGAGSVMDPETFDQAVDMGADFTISPGRCTVLEDHTRDANVAPIPGVITPGEIISARRAGQKLLKFYPSEGFGGATTLKDFCRIFPNVQFMPSGGIREPMLPGYAELPGVLSVGGSWMYAKSGIYRSLPEMTTVMAQSIATMTAASLA